MKHPIEWLEVYLKEDFNVDLSKKQRAELVSFLAQVQKDSPKQIIFDSNAKVWRDGKDVTPDKDEWTVAFNL